MGLFDALFSKKPNVVGIPKAEAGYWQTLTAYKPVFTTRGGSAYESLLVRAAIDSRARHISKLNVVVKGSARPILRTKLEKYPNSFQTWSQFFYRLSTILDMQNTAFTLPVYGQGMNIEGYYPVLPSKCEIVNVSGEAWLRYKFSNGKVGATELKNVTIMTKFQYKDDIFGSSNAAIDQTLDLIDLQSQGIAEAVKTSASYRFMAQMSNFAKKEDIDKEREEFNSYNFSSDSKKGKGGILLFPSTWGNIKQLDPKNYVVDAAQAKQIEQNVYNYFGTNESIIQNKALGDELDAFFNGAIEPFAIQFSEAITKATFTEKELGTGNKIIATANRLQYMSTDKKISLAQQLGDRGMITINEIRELFNYPPLENGGDKLPIRGEYYLINEDGTTTKGESEE